MRIKEIQKAEAAYKAAKDLLDQVKKVEEILLHLVFQMFKFHEDKKRLETFADKAIAIFEKPFNESVLRLADIDMNECADWFVHRSEHRSAEKEIKQAFAIAKLRQIDAVLEAKAMWERELSPSWSYPEWYVLRLEKKAKEDCCSHGIYLGWRVKENGSIRCGLCE